MSDYARLNLLLERDPYSSYPDPEKHAVSAALTPDEGYLSRKVDVGALGDTLSIDISELTTVTCLIVSHNGASGDSNFTVGWTDTSANACTAILAQGGAPLITPDVDPTVAITLVSPDATTPSAKISILGT